MLLKCRSGDDGDASIVEIYRPEMVAISSITAEFPSNIFTPDCERVSYDQQQ